jgi:hypothetical protein
VLNFPSTVRVNLYASPVDLQRSFDGLALAERQVIGEDPLCGHVFVFLNRRRDRVKLLLWICRHRRDWVPLPPTSPVPGDPLGGADTEFSNARLEGCAMRLGRTASLQVRAER